MKKFYTIIKNKYFAAAIILVFYILLLHETDVAALSKRKQRVKQLTSEIQLKKKEIENLKTALNELENISSLEKFAREKYYFKKDDEDIFVLSDK
ncbi:MAG TPA: septum formation initiator family protein [Crocinitomix sp.]|nr:septum formation initiator family protein [Crocinitomix sp.]